MPSLGKKSVDAHDFALTSDLLTSPVNRNTSRFFFDLAPAVLILDEVGKSSG